MLQGAQPTGRRRMSQVKQSRFRADEGVELVVGVSAWGLERERDRKDVPGCCGPDSDAKQCYREGRVAFTVKKNHRCTHPLHDVDSTREH